MKHQKLHILLISALAIIYSCSDDRLDLENPNNLSADSFWSSENDLQQGLIATYAALQLDGLFGGASATQHPVRSDTGRPNNWNANAIGLNKLAFNENSDIVKKRWRDCYIGIYRANQVLANINNIELPSSSRIQIEAEAKFLRGFYYYSLYRGYNNGSVIIHTTVPESSEDFYKSPSPAEDVYNLILSDLEFAYNNLPEQYENNQDIGRATWGAAAAMLGKLFINEHNYTDAKDKFQEIINSNLYGLTANIGDNFDIEHEMNNESIFEIPFSTELKSGTSNGAADGPLGSEATSRARTLATTQGGGYRTIMPSYYITMLFKNDVMDINNPINANRTGNANYSIRASLSIAIADDDNTTLYQRPSNQGGGYNNFEASYLKKFQNWTLFTESDQSISGINERAIRLADIKLLYAECLLMLDESFNEALEQVNAVRQRAGVVLLNSTDYNSESLMEHIMWVERPLELMFEGHDTRWEDLTRWGKVQEQYNLLASKRYVLIQKNLYEFDPNIHTNFTEETALKEFEDAAQAYQPGTHNYFPIPSTEQNSNPNLFN
ncbi:MAG: RagB/SusD family nutrient uptake outer membrane protein [Bacteroidetes bacterium]|nr:RagB/SusD family nutrient uptake outer membrane protein [Bacteroidota bacterium]MDA0859995.1 RagB/SusD family nutrient uptake outer membrane protein [Bacteroidota bacterium]MDA1318092.1 RagB/SusD family nutrient uptake outer membrane protein [Bacteroidota bacterium]